MAVYHNNNGDLELIAGSTNYQFCPIGSILPFGGTTAPNGFFICNGQAISRTDYKELFDVIGTRFGPGNGSTTFNIPDLRGEFLRGAGTNSHSGQGNGSAVGVHQDATKEIAFTPWNQELYYELGAIPSNYDSVTNGPTYQYLQNETGHTGPQEVPSTYTTRPTNTSVNYIIKAKVVGDESDDLTIVDTVQDGNMNAVTSNAVFDKIKQSEWKNYGLLEVVNVGTSSATVDNAGTTSTFTMKDGLGTIHDIGQGGNHAIHICWTTKGYLAFVVDTSVVAVIKGGTILTNIAN